MDDYKIRGSSGLKAWLAIATLLVLGRMLVFVPSYDLYDVATLVSLIIMGEFTGIMFDRKSYFKAGFLSLVLLFVLGVILYEFPIGGDMQALALLSSGVVIGFYIRLMMIRSLAEKEIEDGPPDLTWSRYSEPTLKSIFSKKSKSK